MGPRNSARVAALWIVTGGSAEKSAAARPPRSMLSAWAASGIIVVLNVKYLLDFFGITAWFA